MAMLELAKGGALRLHQADNFSELWVFGRDATDTTAGETP
jgi:chromatin segregation and condensation protein Rec8/ScpA/Scc1 (kleisin family)